MLLFKVLYPKVRREGMKKAQEKKERNFRQNSVNVFGIRRGRAAEFTRREEEQDIFHCAGVKLKCRMMMLIL